MDSLQTTGHGAGDVPSTTVFYRRGFGAVVGRMGLGFLGRRT